MVTERRGGENLIQSHVNGPYGMIEIANSISYQFQGLIINEPGGEVLLDKEGIAADMDESRHLVLV